MEINNSFKTGFITLIGRPNVGKSTLMNHLIGQKIAITSNKPQTTRNRILTVYTDDECQMIFLDTPGIQNTKNKLGEYMTKAAKSTISEVDVVLWLVEPSTYIGEVEKSIAEDLKSCKSPVILVINKIDTVSEESLSKFEEAYKKEMDFAKVVRVAALKGQNIDEVMGAIKQFLPYGPPFYDEDTITDQPERQIAAEIIREKALRLLRDEVPHGIAVTIEKMREREDNPDLMDIEATIICERDSHKGIVIGKGGTMLKKIGSAARKDIEEMVECQVNLQLFVKVRRDWRDDKNQLKNFGYDSRDFK
ncbi:MAG: GTPase Era [Butyrivibrio sp.]|jgi:GTP-binding protein Era|uniref:GTPase Era n=1 Tax=Butyrivibrio sp. TaxID=28121 RepID=UPI001B5AF713|nr:GTPase Era [Butyrivibrio sp.]MBP3273904.1 GTPase Era [Butyrivibrio sp.]MBP3782670.1 GTPase Era [Butyrivibrio sp.]MBP3814234.1 GTPase Era [Butyrivibrio sp.]